MTPCNTHITMYNESYILQRNSDKLAPATQVLTNNNMKYAAASTGFLTDSNSAYAYIYIPTKRISYSRCTWYAYGPLFSPARISVDYLISTKNACANSYSAANAKIRLLA